MIVSNDGYNLRHVKITFNEACSFLQRNFAIMVFPLRQYPTLFYDVRTLNEIVNNNSARYLDNPMTFDIIAYQAEERSYCQTPTVVQFELHLQSIG